MCNAYWHTVNYYTVAGLKSILHTAANHVIATEYEAIQNKSAQCYGAYKSQEAQNIFERRVFLPESGFLFHTGYFSISGRKTLFRAKIIRVWQITSC